jgi:hypothetical protein
MFSDEAPFLKQQTWSSYKNPLMSSEPVPFVHEEEDEDGSQ